MDQIQISGYGRDTCLAVIHEILIFLPLEMTLQLPHAYPVGILQWILLEKDAEMMYETKYIYVKVQVLKK